MSQLTIILQSSSIFCILGALFYYRKILSILHKRVSTLENQVFVDKLNENKSGR